MFKLLVGIFILTFVLTIFVNIIISSSKKQNGVTGALKQKQKQDVDNQLYKATGGFICSKCGCKDYQLVKRGYNLKKGVVGGLFTGGIGLVFGLHGKDRMEKVCVKCGYKE